MNYTEAIDYLKQHNITKPDGTFYEFGEVSWFNGGMLKILNFLKDIPELPERTMTDQINEVTILSL